jgi:hypothetical protein
LYELALPCWGYCATGVLATVETPPFLLPRGTLLK